MRKAGKHRKKPSARRAKLEQEIRSNPLQSDYRAAIAAGYAPSTAHAEASEMAKPVRLAMAEAYRAEGLDEKRSAKKLARLIDAKTVRWNSKRHRWDHFDDGEIQFRAVQEVNRVLDGYPAPKEKVEDARPITIVFPSDMKSLMPAGAEKAGG